MKPQIKKSKKVTAPPKAASNQTLQIKSPWEMSWMEYMDEMLEFLKFKIGPGHPLHRMKLFVSAVNKDADAWFVEGEDDPFYAIVYFGEKKRYGSKLMPRCEILPDWDAVLRRFAVDHEKEMSRFRSMKNDISNS